MEKYSIAVDIGASREGLILGYLENGFNAYYIFLELTLKRKKLYKCANEVADYFADVSKMV
ncbi:hypothetical protein [Lederbergia lenta]|uniref:hypothetical protein n=1 Tax=Lederbergia lenta TaxID=1467 RepID=UPI00203B9FDE|nr:hypothetical protein [Lederbergia lenta]MCM3112847.1 hypothetical protein [Lederbergia lenta]